MSGKRDNRYRRRPWLVAFVCGIGIAALLVTARAEPREKYGLVALWTFDGKTIQGNKVAPAFGDVEGDLVGAPKVVDGVLDKALSFDGAVDYVQMLTDLFFPSVSMEAVIRPVLGTRNPIYDKYNYGIQLLDSDMVGVWIRDSAVQWPSAYTPWPRDGGWHHVVGVVEDQKNVRIYLDGKLMATGDAPNPIDVGYGAAVKPSIAYTRHLGGIWYEGEIDEVAIYDRALTDTEVARLYSLSLAVRPAGKLALTWGSLKR